MKIIAWGKSDTGQKREHNEDNFLIDEKVKLFAVADGMGGHQGGETASRMALEVMQRMLADSIDNLSEVAAQLEAEQYQDLISTRELEPMGDADTVPGRRFQRAQTAPLIESEPTWTCEIVSPPAATVMRAAAEEACVEIFGTSLREPSLHGMGTTLTAMLYHNGRMHIVHAGDSRAYLFRANRLEQLTEDHSWIAEQVKLGAMTESEAKESKYRHIITRSVGFERDVDLDIYGVTVHAGDCFLLCSDGMYNYIDHGELEQLLRMNWFRRTPEVFIRIANDRGGEDNITVVVVQATNDLS